METVLLKLPFSPTNTSTRKLFIAFAVLLFSLEKLCQEKRMRAMVYAICFYGV